MMKLLIFLFVLLLAVGCGPRNIENKVVITGKSINVEIADSEEEKAIGLMFRESLCEDCGMLFVYEDSEIRTFWMKNTLVPLDIIFISDDFKIINIEDAEPCKEDPCKIYSSNGNAKYVLEVNFGFTEKNNVKKGDFVEIKR